jgi:hypothetical protein
MAPPTFLARWLSDAARAATLVQALLPQRSRAFTPPQLQAASFISTLCIVGLVYLSASAAVQACWAVDIPGAPPARNRLRPRGALRALVAGVVEYYAALTHILCFSVLIYEAGVHVADMIYGGAFTNRPGAGAAAPPPRFVLYWTTSAFLLLADIMLALAASVRPISRLLSTALPSVRATRTFGVCEALGEFGAATDLFASRLGALGGTMLLANFGR